MQPIINQRYLFFVFCNFFYIKSNLKLHIKFKIGIFWFYIDKNINLLKYTLFKSYLSQIKDYQTLSFLVNLQNNDIHRPHTSPNQAR